MALQKTSIYQDIVNPNKLQFYGLDASGKAYVKDLTPEEYSQLKNLGIQEQRVNITSFQGEQLTSLDQLKQLATTPLDAQYTAQNYGSGWDEIQKNIKTFSGADFSTLPKTGATFITPEQAAEYKKTSYGGAIGLNAALAAQGLPALQQTIPQNPFVTQAVKVGTSQIDAGKTAIQTLTDLKVSTDTSTIKGNWAKYGLNDRYGEWIGSAVQWNAYSQFVQDQLTQIEAGIKSASSQILNIQSQLGGTVGYKEGDTRTNPTTGKQEFLNPEGSWQEVTTPGQAYGTEQQLIKPGGGFKESISGTTGGVTLTPTELLSTNVGSTDIADIINEITTGEAISPETEVDKAQAELLKQQQTAAAQEAMDKLQQQMAKSGMTFSGIRTQAEASLVASNLAKMSGISLDLSEKIIAAARQEQSRRETALTNAKNLQYNALEAMGYVINPITGELSPTLAKQKAEQPVRFSAGGNVYEYDPTTGTMSTLIEGVGDTPTSYDEWVLAGEQSGTGMSYAEFLSNKGESQTDKDRALKTASFAQAQGALNASKGSDGYVNTALYIRLRSDYAQTIGNAKDFDDVFGHMLNPKDPTASMLIAQIIGI